MNRRAGGRRTWSLALAVGLGLGIAQGAEGNERHATWKKHQVQAVAAVQNHDLERAEAAIDEAMAQAVHFPDLDRRLRATLRQFGWLRSAWISGGEADRADERVETYVALAEGARGTNHPVALEIQRQAAEVDAVGQRLPEARARLERIRPIYIETLGAGDARTIHVGRMLANVLSDQHRHAAAQQLARELFEKAKQSLPPRHAEVVRSRALLGMIAARRGQLDRATKIAAGMKGYPAAGHLQGAKMSLDLAGALRKGGRPEEGLVWALQSLQSWERLAPAPNPALLPPLIEVVHAQVANGRLDAARPYSDRILAIARAESSAPIRANVLGLAAGAAIEEGRLEDAAALLREGQALVGPGGTGASLAPSWRRLAGAEADRGNVEDARRLHQESVDAATGDAERAAALNDFADFELDRGHLQAAERLMAESIAATPLVAGADAARRDTLGRVLLGQGKAAAARTSFEEALQAIPDETRGVVLEHLREALVALDMDEVAIADALSEAAATGSDGLGVGFESERFNFRLSPPGPGWSDVEIPRTNNQALVARHRTFPNTSLRVVAHELGSSMATLSEHAQRLSTSFDLRTDAFQEIASAARRFGDLDGWLLEMKTTEGNGSLDYSIWMTSQNGVLYQFLVWAEAGELPSEARARDLERLAEGFSLIDPDRVIGPTIEILTSLESKRYGYRIPLLGERPWHDWGDHPEMAEAGAIMVGGDVGATVVPIAYLGHKVAPADALPAIAALLNEEIPAGARRSREAGRHEAVFETERTHEGIVYRRRVRLVAGAKAAWLVSASTRGDLSQEPLDLVDGAVFDPRELTVSTIDDLGAADRVRHANFFSGVGATRYGRGQQRSGLENLAIAVELDPTPNHLRNLVVLLMNSGRAQDAIHRLNEHPEMVAANPDLLARRALALGTAGRNDEALTDYAAAFAEGFEGPDFRLDYADRLFASGREEEAIALLEQAGEQSGAAAERVALATMLDRQGKAAEAIAILEGVAADHPGDFSALFSLGTAYTGSGRFVEGLATFDRVTELVGDQADNLRARAAALYGLARYREAQESLEAALELAPSSDAIRGDLDHVSALLGEGSSEALRTPIEPVALAAKTGEPETLPAAALDGASAYWKLHSIGLHFQPGGGYRKTVREVITVLEPAGVDALSSLKIAFHPLGEEIFINELVVRDAAGDVVGTGDPNEYYVLDQPGPMATSNKEAHIPVPGLAAGRTIHLTYTLRDRSVPDRLPLIAETLSRRFPVARSEVFLFAPADSFEATHASGVRATREGDATVWSVQHPPAHWWEPMQSPERAFLPWIMVHSAGEDWRAAGLSYLALIADRLPPEASLEAIAARETAGASSADEKARRLHAYTQKQLTYEAIEFGRRALVPNPIREILERRYGDCKDHALLLHQLLGFAGVSSRMALVSAKQPIVPAVPSIDQFDHMVVECTGCTEERFFDATRKHWTGRGDTPLGLAGRQALVLDAKEPHLTRIPDYRPEEHFVETDRDVTIETSGDLTVRETIRLGGYAAAVTRSILTSVERGEWKAAVIQGIFTNLRVRSIEALEVDALLDSDAPLILRLTYHVSGAFQQTDRGRVGLLPAPWAEVFLRATAVDERLAPFQIHFPVRVLGQTRVRGAGRVTVFGDVESEGAGPFSEWTSTRTTADTPTIRWNVTRKTGEHPAASYAEFVGEMNRILDSIARSALFDAASPGS